jgi:hypothetical protein
LFEKCGGDDFFLFSEMARKLWLTRNAWIYEGTFIHPDIIVWEAGRAVKEFEQANRLEGWRIIDL